MRESKFNVDKDKSKRTHNGITFDSVMEMKYYRDVLCPLVESGDIVSLELQKPFELQPSFVRNDKTVRPITYIADFVFTYKNGHEVVVDTKGCPDVAAKLKRKMFWYKFPDVDYRWICYSKMDGGWCDYEDVKNRRNRDRLEKKHKAERAKGGKSNG